VKSYPRPLFTLKKNGDNVSGTVIQKRIKEIGIAVLDLKNILRKDGGNYTCSFYDDKLLVTTSQVLRVMCK
jgi:hypothetical protein